MHIDDYRSIEQTIANAERAAISDAQFAPTEAANVPALLVARAILTLARVLLLVVNAHS